MDYDVRVSSASRIVFVFWGFVIYFESYAIRPCDLPVMRKRQKKQVLVKVVIAHPPHLSIYLNFEVLSLPK